MGAQAGDNKHALVFLLVIENLICDMLYCSVTVANVEKSLKEES